MTCKEIQDGNLLEAYTGGTLPREQRDAMEFHLRSCIECGRALRKLRGEAVAQEKPKPKKEFQPKRGVAGRRIALAAAVVLALAGAGGYWYWKSNQVPAKPKFVPVEVKMPTGELAPSRDFLLQELAGTAPLGYMLPHTPPADAARATLRQAMQLYTNRKFGQAVNPLMQVIDLDPSCNYAKLYLGVCHLMEGENVKAQQVLTEITKSSDATYRNEANFYLSKALFAQRNIDEGEQVLQKLAKSDSTYTAYAKRNLANIGALR